jgi:hypothetical protein
MSYTNNISLYLGRRGKEDGVGEGESSQRVGVLDVGLEQLE